MAEVVNMSREQWDWLGSSIRSVLNESGKPLCLRTLYRCLENRQGFPAPLKKACVWSAIDETMARAASRGNALRYVREEYGVTYQMVPSGFSDERERVILLARAANGAHEHTRNALAGEVMTLVESMDRDVLREICGRWLGLSFTDGAQTRTLRKMIASNIAHGRRVQFREVSTMTKRKRVAA